jgi:hypothetical protein
MFPVASYYHKDVIIHILCNHPPGNEAKKPEIRNQLVGLTQLIQKHSFLPSLA